MWLWFAVFVVVILVIVGLQRIKLERRVSTAGIDGEHVISSPLARSRSGISRVAPCFEIRWAIHCFRFTKGHQAFRIFLADTDRSTSCAEGAQIRQRTARFFPGKLHSRGSGENTCS